MKNLISAVAVGCCLSVAQAATWDVTLNLNGLNGGNEVPANTSPALGGPVGVGIRYDDASNVLTVNAAYGIFGWAPLTGTYEGAHLHLGAAGEEGPVLVDLASLHLPFNANSGFFSGNVTLSGAAGSALMAGNIYMNIHSSAFPGGEIRGFLTPVPEPATTAAIAGGVLGAFAIARRFRSKKTA